MAADARVAGGAAVPADAPVLIGIDVGTSSVRAIAFDALGRRVAAETRPTPIRLTETGGEYDPEAIFATVVENLAGLGRALAGRRVAGIAVASVGESCVLIDASGRALAPSIVWHDRRTANEAPAIEAALGRERIFALSGHAVEPIFTLAKLIWMRAHWSDAMAKARHVLMMADWVAFRLSGVAATDPTLASRTLYFDIRQRRWSEELLALAGLTPDFPVPLAASGTPLGAVRRDVLAATGLAGDPIVGVGGHDHIVGALATGLTEPGAAINSIGTAEALALATPSPLADPELLRRGYVQGAIEADRKHSYIAGALLSAGGAIEWFRAILGGVSQERLIAEAAKVPPGSRGIVFLPHLANGPPPHPDANARGAFLGLTQNTTHAELYRAVLEGVALQSRLMLDGMTTLAGVDAVRTIRLIGGVARNPLFLSIKANAFARPLIVVDEPEVTALGAALLGGLAAGVYKSPDAAVAALDRKEHVVQPDATAERYAELRTMVFERVQESMRPVNASLAAFAAAETQQPSEAPRDPAASTPPR
jgi:xylulokinase